MIDYYFATGDFACEKDVINIPKCGMCDNCNRLHTLKMTDISKESICIVNTIRENNLKNGYDFGLKKTIKIIQKSTEYPIIPKKSDKWIKDAIDILVTKNVLKRYKAGFGFVIGVGRLRIKDALPIKGRIEDSVIKLKLNIANHHSKADKLLSLMNLRNIIAKKYGFVPASFMNDRVVMNINDAQPKTISELWKVDGISNEFIMSPQCLEFMDEYVKLYSKKKLQNGNKNGKMKNRDKVFSLYKKKKSIREIAKTLNLKPLTVENHLFHILEFYEDVDIEPDYFELSEEREEIIKKAILKVGTRYLRPIKDILPDNVTYAQIKLCILIMKIEGAFE